MRVPVLVAASALFISTAAFAGAPEILTNHLGYETTGSKHAVILGHSGDTLSKCALKASPDRREVFTTDAKASGPVQKWRDWYFWTIDFDSVTSEGQFYLECASNQGAVRSYPFTIQKQLLEENTLSDVIYYFKEERNSGQMAKADSHLAFQDGKSRERLTLTVAGTTLLAITASICRTFILNVFQSAADTVCRTELV